MDSSVPQLEQRTGSGAGNPPPQDASASIAPSGAPAPNPGTETATEPETATTGLDRDGQAYSDTAPQDAHENPTDGMEGVQQEQSSSAAADGDADRYNAFVNHQEHGHGEAQTESHGQEGLEAGAGDVSADGDGAQAGASGEPVAQRDDDQHHHDAATQEQDEAGKQRQDDTHNPFAEEPSPIAVEAATQLKAPAFLIKLYNILSDPDPQVKSLVHWASPEAVQAFAEATAQAERLQSEGMGRGAAQGEAPGATEGAQDSGEQPGTSSQQPSSTADKTAPLTLSEVISYDFFVVEDAGDFSKLVLPRYFKHNNWQSFVRQLNMYDFRKLNDFAQAVTTSGPGVWHWRHPYFQRGRPGMLSRIERKAVGGASASKKRKSEMMRSELAQVPGATAGTKAAALAAKSAGSPTGDLKAGDASQGDDAGEGASGSSSLAQEVQRLKARLEDQSQQLAEMRMHITAVWQLMSAQSGFAADAIESLASGSASSGGQEDGTVPAEENQASSEERLNAVKRSASSIRSLIAVTAGLAQGRSEGATEADQTNDAPQAEVQGAEGSSSAHSSSANTSNILSSIPLFLQLVNSGSSNVAQAVSAQGLLSNGAAGPEPSKDGRGDADDTSHAEAIASEAAEEDHLASTGSPTSPNDSRKRKKPRSQGPSAPLSQAAAGAGDGTSASRPVAPFQPPATLQELLSQANALAAAQAGATAAEAGAEAEGDTSHREERMDEGDDAAHDMQQHAEQGDADAEAMDEGDATQEPGGADAHGEQDAEGQQDDQVVHHADILEPQSTSTAGAQTDNDPEIYGARALDAHKDSNTSSVSVQEGSDAQAVTTQQGEHHQQQQSSQQPQTQEASRVEEATVVPSAAPVETEPQSAAQTGDAPPTVQPAQPAALQPTPVAPAQP